MSGLEQVYAMWQAAMSPGATMDKANSTPLNNPAAKRKYVTLYDWEIGDEVLEATTSVMDRFIKEAQKRYADGVKEYRGGDETKPFQGDILENLAEEQLDSFVYAKEAAKAGLVSDTEGDQLNCYAFDAYKLVRRIQENLKAKEEAGDANGEQ